MRCLIALCVGMVLVVSPGAGQDRYRAHGDSVFMLVINPYKMYWLRGSDTLGEPIHSVAVEAQSWRQRGSGLEIAIRQLQLDVSRNNKVDTFAISPFGAVETINGKPPGLNERVDLLLRLPGRRLTPGLTWSDTLRSRQSGPSGNDSYEIARAYRVQRLFDSAGARLAEVSSLGVARYKHSWWTDSAAGKFIVFDVTGPDTERFVFSVSTGQLLNRTWSMGLVGSSIVPDSTGGVDTIPAGLISGETQTVISRERARLLMRPMPGADTSITFVPGGGTVFKHTVERRADTIQSGMIRNDGLFGTAQGRFNAGLLQSYESIWTDTTAVPRQTSISVSGDSLRIRDPQEGDTSVALPSPWWGVADYAMQEFLVPTLLAHPADGKDAKFAIYRPYPRHWDVGVASIRRVGLHFVASYLMGSDTTRTYLLITQDGDFLFGENSDPTGAQRAPVEGSVRRTQLEEILRTLRN